MKLIIMCSTKEAGEAQKWAVDLYRQTGTMARVLVHTEGAMGVLVFPNEPEPVVP